MSETAIKVEHLHKAYRIGMREQRSDTLAAVLIDAVRQPIRNLRNLRRLSTFNNDTLIANDVVWALKDVSFEVRPGEVIGVIGRNGAGKSTLLKVLSRITHPTSGRVTLRGRVSSLLEVGTGFHPELTGRENVYLNGTVLGMRKAEIDRKFDEIVEFAGVEAFIDTVVKRYSSGMSVRLAFAVAAHLEPEILLIDEVLAVGDIEFQQKSLGQLDKVSKSGRTVLFVSHQMNQIRRLCTKCIWVDHGSIKRIGPTHDVLGKYEASSILNEPAAAHNETSNAKAQFLSWGIEGNPKPMMHTLDHFGLVRFCFTIEIRQPVLKGHHGLVLYDARGQVMWSAGVDDIRLDVGRHDLTYLFSSLPLKPGPYQWFMTFFERRHGNERLDSWYAIPILNIATPPVTHPMERFQAILNLAAHFEVD